MHDKIGGKKEEVFSSLLWSLQYTHELCHLIMESRDDVQVNSLQIHHARVKMYMCCQASKWMMADEKVYMWYWHEKRKQISLLPNKEKNQIQATLKTGRFFIHLKIVYSILPIFMPFVRLWKRLQPFLCKFCSLKLTLCILEFPKYNLKDKNGYLNFRYSL